ncbi:transmembrane protein 265 [Emydura macquarii macquarii]|uniref:transmembrane protein 265 n=1 Tax=Emydura macquarii macquarii TaxID=1129001 RepID=UPI00352B40B0
MAPPQGSPQCPMEEEMELGLGNGCAGKPTGDATETAVMIQMKLSQPELPARTPRPRTLRYLAIGSIVCGCSCLGVLALIYAVKANEKWKTNSPDADLWARKSFRFSLLSIGVWVSLLILVPLFIGLISYLIARAE